MHPCWGPKVHLYFLPLFVATGTTGYCRLLQVSNDTIFLYFIKNKCPTFSFAQHFFSKKKFPRKSLFTWNFYHNSFCLRYCFYKLLQVTTEKKKKKFTASYFLTIYQVCSFKEYRLILDISVRHFGSTSCFALVQVRFLIQLSHWFWNSFCFSIKRYINHVRYFFNERQKMH